MEFSIEIYFSQDAIFYWSSFFMSHITHITHTSPHSILYALITTSVHNTNWRTSTIFGCFKSWSCCFWNHVVENCFDKTHVFHYIHGSSHPMRVVLILQTCTILLGMNEGWSLYWVIPNSWIHPHLPLYISRKVVRVNWFSYGLISWLLLLCIERRSTSFVQMHP